MYRIIKKEQERRTYLSHSEMELKCKYRCNNGKKIQLLIYTTISYRKGNHHQVTIIIDYQTKKIERQKEIEKARQKGTIQHISLLLDKQQEGGKKRGGRRKTGTKRETVRERERERERERNRKGSSTPPSLHTCTT